MKSSHTAEVSEHPPIHDGSSTTQTVTSNYPVHQVSVGKRFEMLTVYSLYYCCVFCEKILKQLFSF